MPYIKDYVIRKMLDIIIKKNMVILTPNGNLNYFLFKLAKSTCYSYKTFKEFRGELIEAHDEIGRRLLAPYEDDKIKENGDVE